MPLTRLQTSQCQVLHFISPYLPSGMFIISLISYLLNNWLHDYSKCAACHSSSLHLSWTFRMGWVKWFPGSPWLPGHRTNSQWWSICSEVRGCPALLLRGSLCLLSSKPGNQNIELEHRAPPGLAEQAKSSHHPDSPQHRLSWSTGP